MICQIEEWKRTAWATGAHETRGILHVLDEIVIPNSNTVEAAEQFMERVRGYPNLPLPIAVKI